MRKLASIEVIDKLEPIPNADRILKATIKGWECVVAKSDNFQVGDKVIYIEVDSVLPARPEFMFLKDRGYRVRTIKLRKQISQGLVLPLHYVKGNYQVGDDVTKQLGIKKYDPQKVEEKKLMQPSGKHPVIKWLFRFKWFRELYYKFKKTNKPFPTDIVSKTDEERWQNMVDKINQWSAEKVKFTVCEKVDGSSLTTFMYKGTFGVCSRNIWLAREDNSPYWEVARRFHLQETLKALCKRYGVDRVAIQGEVIGANIQGNKYKISGYDFYVFNIVVDGLRLDQETVCSLCKEYNLKTVPVQAYNYVIPQNHDLAKFAQGKSVINSDTEREGLVLRNYSKGISFKTISPIFLLKEEE